MHIKYISKIPTVDEFNDLTEAVDWGRRDNNIVKETFYEKFGFISRPNEELGAGMILYNKWYKSRKSHT